ncbi:RagB/SusD family nutrient uptake outer membrane protein [Pedobacter jeongneungensis]|uniref:RagB/SusD family nutrient uptake outer membrane protein n=1 Tax=Pedobacter jeongneungensis TaxID=947309 RepID=A0ABP8B2B7_9SPHI
MKIKIKEIAGVLAITIVGFSACKKPLYETEPISQDITYVFDKTDSLGVQAKTFLADIYSYLPNGYNRIGNDVLDAASDDAISSSPASTIEYFVNGRISAVSPVDNSWDNNYKTIRKVNIFLANIDVVPLNQKGLKVYWKAEARILRAIAYFELIKRFGGVPLMGDRVLGVNDDIQLPRNSYADCLKYIVDECDALKTIARPDNSLAADEDYGRMTQGVALALKARVLLYDASPLNNPNNDLTKWASAAQAAKDVMSLNIFSLTAAYTSVFNTRKNTEVILAYQRGVTFDLETRNAPVGYTATNASGSGYTSPTQELVDAFDMANGRAISDPASGYNAADPYAGRDPRFYRTIFYNNSKWLNRIVQTYDGGLDKPGSAVNVQTRTGYYMRKFLNETFETATVYSNQTHNFPIFRYAEILLNYAEAMNEAADNAVNRTEAFNQLKAIRLRAGIAIGSTAGYQYGLKTTMSQAEMREAIRHERRVEMAFEEQRFWDIRRWKIAENVLNGTLHGMQIIKNANGTFSYTRTNALNVSFDASKMYRYPIAASEVNKNRNLTQNPGW